MEKRFTGKVIWFNSEDGFGFLEWTDPKGDSGISPSKDGTQKDMFIHFSAVNMTGYRTLKKDQTVEFGIGENNRGEPIAIEAVVVAEP